MGLFSWLKKSKEEKKEEQPAPKTEYVSGFTTTTTEHTGYISNDSNSVSVSFSASESTIQTSSRKTSVRILIDNGHGADTMGKRSPDGRLLEYKYAREVARAVVTQLKAHGYNASLLVVEDNDVTIRERVRRVNAACKKVGATNVLLVSVHCNAAGSDGKWHDARGWQACVSLNASVRSMKLAECLADAALKYGLKLRKPTPTQKWWQQNIGICRDTNCPAVLTENLFMDNKDDVAYLLTKEGKQAVVNVHVRGIMDYIG